MIRLGQLKAHRLGHGYRILDRDIQAFFAQQDAAASTPPDPPA
jgi:hypothetical protein